MEAPVKSLKEQLDNIWDNWEIQSPLRKAQWRLVALNRQIALWFWEVVTGFWYSVQPNPKPRHRLRRLI